MIDPMMDPQAAARMQQARDQAMANFDETRYCIPGSITVNEVRDMKRAFDMIDEDGSSFIDAEELQGAAVALGIPMEDNIAVLLGTEKIDFDMFFKRMTAKLSLDDRVDDILNIFELFDQDSSGTISLDNLLNVAKILGAKQTPQEIQNMLSTLDSDGDGELDPVDFYTCLVSGMRLRLEEEHRLQQADMEAHQQMYPEGQGGSGRVSGSRIGGMSASGIR